MLMHNRRITGVLPFFQGTRTARDLCHPKDVLVLRFFWLMAVILCLELSLRRQSVTESKQPPSSKAQVHPGDSGLLRHSTMLLCGNSLCGQHLPSFLCSTLGRDSLCGSLGSSGQGASPQPSLAADPTVCSLRLFLRLRGE